MVAYSKFLRNSQPNPQKGDLEGFVLTHVAYQQQNDGNPAFEKHRLLATPKVLRKRRLLGCIS